MPDLQHLPFELWQTWAWVSAAGAIFLFLRYATLVGLMEWIFRRARFRGRYTSGEASAVAQNSIRGTRPPGQTRRELQYAAATSVIFGASTAALLWAWQADYLMVYLHWAAYPYWWLPVSLAAAMLLHETYYYWLHRAMHHPAIYPWLHRGHHDSIITSGWTSFSFDPGEAVLQAGIIPLILMVVPMHGAVLVVWLTVMTLSAIINHLGVELYPLPLKRTWWGRNIIGATHHGLHHTRFSKNFGLYFTFWDRWMGTETWGQTHRSASPSPNPPRQE